MNIEDLVNKALEHLGFSTESKDGNKSDNSKENLKFEATATLEDGTEIFSTADEWAVGVPVFTRGEDGEPVSVPDGQYQLSDGNVLTVEDGLLADLSAPEEAPADEDMSAKAIAEVKEGLSELAKALLMLNEKVDKGHAAFEAATKEIQAKLSATPAQPSVKTQKKNGSKIDLSQIKNPTARALAILNSNK